MSPARQHRDRLAASAAAPATPIDADAKGGALPTAFEVQLTPARAHRIAAAVTSELPGDLIDATGGSGDPVAAQIALRLAHDLRRLKGIQSVARKVEAKREMFGEYTVWCDAILSAERGNVVGIAAEVLPTIMVWSIDIGDWARALELAGYVIAEDVPLPSRYQRSAPALVAENVAEVALAAQVAGNAFPLDVLEAFEELTGACDMHDQIRAKLLKAIGTEQQRVAEAAVGDAIVSAAQAALATLKRARALDARVGVKDRVNKLEKLIRTVEKAEADRLAGERAEADRLAAEQAEADRVAAEQAEAERLAAEHAGGEREGSDDTDQAGQTAE